MEKKIKINRSLLPYWFCIYLYIVNSTSDRNDKEHMILWSHTGHSTFIKNGVKRRIYLIFSRPSLLSKSSVCASAKIIATKSRKITYLIYNKMLSFFFGFFNSFIQLLFWFIKYISGKPMWSTLKMKRAHFKLHFEVCFAVCDWHLKTCNSKE